MRIWPDKYFTQSLEPETFLFRERGLNQNIPAKYLLTRQMTIFHSHFGAVNAILGLPVFWIGINLKSRSYICFATFFLSDTLTWVVGTHVGLLSKKSNSNQFPVNLRVKTRIVKEWCWSPHNNRRHVEASLNAQLVTCIKHAVVDMDIISIFSTAIITVWWGDGYFRISKVF